jgi:hypothetical protein
MIIKLKNDSVYDHRKSVKVGFSWTTLLFGGLVPLFRGNASWCIAMVVVAICTFGISWIVFPFFYNKVYLIDLLEKGYTLVDSKDEDKVRKYLS